MKKIIFLILFFIVTILLLGFLVKGNGSISLNYQYNYDTNVGGPFESSANSSRFALTRSIVENGSLTFNDTLARFSSPDITEKNGKLFSLFTPGVSFVGIPFYVLGKSFGIPQLLTFFTTIIFALINIFLIGKIAQKLGTTFLAGLFGGFVFLFATNALGYSLSLAQHIYSTTMILLALWLSIGKVSLIKDMLLGVVAGMGLLFDIPNILFMLPILIYVLIQHFGVEKDNQYYKLFFNTSILTFIIGMMPFLIFFGWYNYKTAGSYTSIAQFIGRSDKYQVVTAKPISSNLTSDNKEIILLNTPFSTRRELGGFYTLLLSNERSWIYFSPVLLFGFIGLYISYKSRLVRNSVLLCLSVILINIVTYSMFADPWGGWSFGPRYLIPSAAILSIGLAIFINRMKKNLVIMLIFLAVLFRSIFISSLGAMTTNLIPPKIEAEHLATFIPYTYDYNFQLAASNNSSSLFYNSFLKAQLGLPTFIIIFSGTAFILAITLYLLILKEERLSR